MISMWFLLFVRNFFILFSGALGRDKLQENTLITRKHTLNWRFPIAPLQLEGTKQFLTL